MTIDNVKSIIFNINVVRISADLKPLQVKMTTNLI